MDQATINRYQQMNPDTLDVGDIYASLEAQFGTDKANTIADAALSGDETKINAAIVQAKYGNALNTSTGSLFYNQITTNPLAAPLESANKLLGNTFLSFLKNPWVLGTAALLVFFFVFDGVNIIKGKLKK